MEWTQFVTFFVGMAALVIWVDSRNRAEIISIRELINSIQMEIKDFHGRLCALEEKYRKDK